MSKKEQQPDRSREPHQPTTLPPELAAFLQDRPFACLPHGSDQGTIYTIKAPASEIRSVRGNVPIHLRHELYAHPAAPVIRTVITIADQPECPLVFECFTNVGDAHQRADFVVLVRQKHLDLLFYDERLRHRLSKRVRNAPPEMLELILDEATQLLGRISRARFDFDRAKRDVMRQTGF